MLEEFKFPKKVFLNVCGSRSGYKIINILIFVVNIQERGSVVKGAAGHPRGV